MQLLAGVHLPCAIIRSSASNWSMGSQVFQHLICSFAYSGVPCSNALKRFYGECQPFLVLEGDRSVLVELQYFAEMLHFPSLQAFKFPRLERLRWKFTTSVLFVLLPILIQLFCAGPFEPSPCILTSCPPLHCLFEQSFATDLILPRRTLRPKRPYWTGGSSPAVIYRRMKSCLAMFLCTVALISSKVPLAVVSGCVGIVALVDESP